MRYFICLLAISALFSCRSSKVPQLPPFEVARPDSLPDPQPANGWEFIRTSPTHGVYLPPKTGPAKVKYKNVGNTTIKDVGNTVIKDNKDKSVMKEKPRTTARKGAAIGDGNTVQPPEKKSLWWAVLLAGGVLAAVVALAVKIKF